MFQRHAAASQALVRIQIFGCDQRQLKAIWIDECQGAFAKDLLFRDRRHLSLGKALRPELQRTRGDCICGGRHLRRSDPPALRAGPGEECHDRSRAAALIAVVKVIARRIVEVDGELDESQRQDTGVEIDVRLRIRGDRGDVVDAEDRG